ncbi:MAG: hypothetical protein ACFFCW_34455 [Candidatus Hodarchaeota archaeon]
MLICHFSICIAGESSDPNNNSKYLYAVRTFADNVLKYGRDTYSPKHTPLFVDGLNINTHEPVKWISLNEGTGLNDPFLKGFRPELMARAVEIEVRLWYY